MYEGVFETNLASVEKLKLIPDYEGITYFEEIDKRYVTIDTDIRSIPGAQTVHFDPNSGVLYFLTTQKDGAKLLRSGFGYNLRTNEYLSSRDRDKDPKTDGQLQKALSLLDPQYKRWLTEPPGYPEVKKLVQSKEKEQTIPFENLRAEVEDGDCILFYDYSSKLHACQSQEISPITDVASVQNGYRVFKNGTSPSVDIDDFNFHATKKDNIDSNNVFVGAVLPNDHKFVLYKDKQGIWKITKDELATFQRYVEIPFDPSIEYPLSREEYIVAAALDAMAFDRWGASIQTIRSSNPTRYEGVTKENIQKAVSNLIDRFGESSFTNAIKWISYQHMYRLHTPRHRTKVLLAQNNAFGDVHSDIIGFTKDISELARQAIRDTHPVAIDMQKDGYGRVGEGVYNAKSVFGDIDLLETLRDNYSHIFDELIDYIATLPPIEQGDWYGNSRVNPLAAIREYFPTSYELIESRITKYITRLHVPGIEFESSDS